MCLTVISLFNFNSVADTSSTQNKRLQVISFKSYKQLGLCYKTHFDRIIPPAKREDYNRSG